MKPNSFKCSGYPWFFPWVQLSTLLYPSLSPGLIYMDYINRPLCPSGIPLSPSSGRNWLHIGGWDEIGIVVFILLAPYLLNLGLEVCMWSFSKGHIFSLGFLSYSDSLSQVPINSPPYTSGLRMAMPPVISKPGVIHHTLFISYNLNDIVINSSFVKLSYYSF